MDWSVRDISYKRDLTTGGLLRLASLARPDDLEDPPHCVGGQGFDRCQSSVHFRRADGPHCAYPFVLWETSGYFHFGAIVNGAAMSMPVELFMWIPVVTPWVYTHGCKSSVMKTPTRL